MGAPSFPTRTTLALARVGEPSALTSSPDYAEGLIEADHESDVRLDILLRIEPNVS
jgi:hypothetical protein